MDDVGPQVDKAALHHHRLRPRGRPVTAGDGRLRLRGFLALRDNKKGDIRNTGTSLGNCLMLLHRFVILYSVDICKNGHNKRYRNTRN